MKTLIIVLIGLLSTTTLVAQESFAVPQLTPDQEKEVLYNHVYAYFTAGLNMAKEKGVSPEAYGKYIGEEFKAFWNPEAGFAAFVNQIMFILKGVNPYSEMEIKEQNEKMVRFTMSNMNLSFKEGGPFGVSYNDFLVCSDALISTIANHMNADFSYKDTDGLYEVTITAQ
ncbi:hypothetical protein SLH46_06030 [Draconibacterium sp. IB214405]|uniref:hypothetical protein n=1 Tax=Draconibacterium sp. IB214405 TaxID=3097352 RepID=UPI002A174770|nr:hypothetical protein [Draconibacterium sp. IB214405]MDX8338730.1 hypothetical protein [Draconibacterium sp. IB214405]